MRTKNAQRKPKSPLAEGLGYGFVSMLAIDRTSPNRLLIASWIFFLAYLLLRFYGDNHPENKAPLAPFVRYFRVLGWFLIGGLAAISCVGARQ